MAVCMKDWQQKASPEVADKFFVEVWHFCHVVWQLATITQLKQKVNALLVLQDHNGCCNIGLEPHLLVSCDLLATFYTASAQSSSMADKQS